MLIKSRQLTVSCLALLSLLGARDTLSQERARWQIGANAIAGFPQGEFRNSISDTRWGGSGYFTYRWRDTPLRLGGELGLFGNGREDIGLFGLSPLVQFDDDFAQVTNSIYFGRFIARVQPVYGRLSPYVEGVAGLSGFETAISLKNCVDYCEVGTVLSNVTYSVGAGAGVAIRLTQDEARQSGISIEVGFRYLLGGETEYFLSSDLDAIAEGDRPFPERSRTNMATVSIGVVFDF